MDYLEIISIDYLEIISMDYLEIISIDYLVIFSIDYLEIILVDQSARLSRARSGESQSTEVYHLEYLCFRKLLENLGNNNAVLAHGASHVGF